MSAFERPLDHVERACRYRSLFNDIDSHYQLANVLPSLKLRPRMQLF